MFINPIPEDGISLHKYILNFVQHCFYCRGLDHLLANLLSNVSYILMLMEYIAFLF